MEKLNQKLFELNYSILDLENQIQKEIQIAEENIKPLNRKLAQVKEDKRNYASKNDFESVQDCIRRENNLKFIISSQWNKCSLLENDLSKLKKEKSDLENQIKLKKDQIKRNNEILSQMDKVLNNYKKSQSLKQAAVDSKIDYNHVQQWYEWGKNDFNETYNFFYTKIIEINNYFKELEAQKLKRQMDDVIKAYKKTNSLKEASIIANVSYDTVKYWYEWGSRGFGEENTYFFQRVNK